MKSDSNRDTRQGSRDLRYTTTGISPIPAADSTCFDHSSILILSRRLISSLNLPIWISSPPSRACPSLRLTMIPKASDRMPETSRSPPAPFVLAARPFRALVVPFRSFKRHSGETSQVESASTVRRPVKPVVPATCSLGASQVDSHRVRIFDDARMFADRYSVSFAGSRFLERSDVIRAFLAFAIFGSISAHAFLDSKLGYATFASGGSEYCPVTLSYFKLPIPSFPTCLNRTF